ncbi:MAG: hypothetical protein MZV70_21920 [Desulfobacterales bacterium]|nr:hypothetical protein [Desulfobacterales bacterium]
MLKNEGPIGRTGAPLLRYAQANTPRNGKRRRRPGGKSRSRLPLLKAAGRGSWPSWRRSSSAPWPRCAAFRRLPEPRPGAGPTASPAEGGDPVERGRVRTDTRPERQAGRRPEARRPGPCARKKTGPSAPPAVRGLPRESRPSAPPDRPEPETLHAALAAGTARAAARPQAPAGRAHHRRPGLRPLRRAEQLDRS